MKDLDKLLAGKEIYRNEDKKALADKWEGWANIFQFGSLGGLFVMIFVLEALPKEQAKIVVWYMAGFLFITSTIGFFLGRKALKYRMVHLNAEASRVKAISNDAISRMKDYK